MANPSPFGLSSPFGLPSPFGDQSGGGGGSGGAPAFTNFVLSALLDTTVDSGAAIAATPVFQLRFSVDGGTTYCLPGFGNCSALTSAIEPDGKSIRISGFANAAQRNAVLAIHKGMPFYTGARDFYRQLFAENTELPDPRIAADRPRPPGLGIANTKYDTPIGVTA